jgi:hypothetical protein
MQTLVLPDIDAEGPVVTVTVLKALVLHNPLETITE